MSSTSAPSLSSSSSASSGWWHEDWLRLRRLQSTRNNVANFHNPILLPAPEVGAGRGQGGEVVVADGAVREVEVRHGGVQEAGQLLARHAASLG